MSKTSTHSRGVAALLAAGFLAGTLGGCQDKPQPKPPPPPPPNVVVTPVVQEPVPIVMEFVGVLKAYRKVDVIPRVSGFIQKRSFVEGAAVKEGDLLYELDPGRFKADLEKFTAELDGNKSKLAFYQSEVERYTAMAKKGAASEQQVESFQAKLDEGKAAVEQSQAAIDNTELDLGYTKITAPCDGQAQQTRINVGELVTQHKTVLTTVVQLDPIYAVFNVSRAQVFDMQKLVKQGFAKKPFGVEVLLPDGSTYAHKGEVDFVSKRIDPSTDSIEVRGVIPNTVDDLAELMLVPGQYIPVRLLVGTNPDALVVPEKCLIQNQMGSFLLVVGGDGKVERRAVEVGDAHEGRLVITKGVAKDENVIVDGLQKVRPGMTVKTEPLKPSDS